MQHVAIPCCVGGFVTAGNGVDGKIRGKLSILNHMNSSRQVISASYMD